MKNPAFIKNKIKRTKVLYFVYQLIVNYSEKMHRQLRDMDDFFKAPSTSFATQYYKFTNNSG